MVQRFTGIVTGDVVEDPLIAIWNTAPFLNAFYGIDLKEYYYQAKTKLEVQLRFQNRFPEFYCFPGIWADYGAIIEPSAFGCRIEWPEGGMPMAQPVIRTEVDLRSLKKIEPKKDGLMPRALDQYRYFWDHLDVKYIEEYGYLDGLATSFGPVELAAVLMGHEHFFTKLIEDPLGVHELLKVTTDSVIRWLEAQERINGSLKRIILADHIPGQVSRSHFEEFWIPYTNTATLSFPDAMVFYHNEFPIPYVDALAEFRFHVFHFGGELGIVKKAIGEKVTLAGNLHPVSLMLSASAEEVYKAALQCLEIGASGGRFLLSTAGGLAPGTPLRNLLAMEEALDSFRKENRSPVS